MEEIERNYKKELEVLKQEYEDFVYIVSHDIKTPMRAISNIATWIEDDLDPSVGGDIISNFNLLKNRVGRLESMMNGLLELSRVNRVELEFYEINIPKIISESIETLEDKENVDFLVINNLSNENVDTLGKKLTRVLNHLITNAVRFNNKEKKEVVIELNETAEAYEIKISDDGPGVPEAVKDKIFSIFYTVNSKDVVDSTGAGLAISSKILQVVGGSIKYETRDTGGSIFTFNWPKTITLKI
ncbi:sensor histidine kinase [Flavobacterium hiemivividum]|uniref:histidine kinase n=1 Tax=Flavobacterium hiemivividum TaxID=2541734 RepID=A0A4R5CM53_9FLAO|nr:HAMP domain-containing sensor histidine kinase [Flavobacterium hiemivividum]TDE01419.1 HAMP domain-containing histidine kinase [Flavobacterium hiemivividum]